MTARAGSQNLNPRGGVHGGFAATVLDSATGCTVHSMLEAGLGYGTVDLQVKNAATCAARSGPRGGRPHGPPLAEHRNLGRYVEIPRREASRDGDGNVLFEERLNRSDIGLSVAANTNRARSRIRVTITGIPSSKSAPLRSSQCFRPCNCDARTARPTRRA